MKLINSFSFKSFTHKLKGTWTLFELNILNFIFVINLNDVLVIKL